MKCFIKGKVIVNEKGFTVVEIIAVLIILGVLAAVAVPKYIDIADKAREYALDGALAEGISTISMTYAHLMLSNAGKATTTDVAKRAADNTPASQDFSYTFTANETGVAVKVVTKPGGKLSQYTGEKTKTWTMP